MEMREILSVWWIEPLHLFQVEWIYNWNSKSISLSLLSLVKEQIHINILDVLIPSTQTDFLRVIEYFRDEYL